MTVFATMKPFRGRAAVLQRNAVLSWILLRPRPEVLLFGDEDGVAEISAEFGLRHVPAVARNEFGTPLVSDLFQQAQRLARADILCYANGDIVLTDDLLAALRTVEARRSRRHVLATGQRWNVPVDGPIDLGGGWQSELIRRAAAASTSTGGGYSLDYFVFSKGLYDDVPPFAVGRPAWDTWMVYGARRRGAMVIDLSAVVRAIHQAHEAPRRPAGTAWSYPVETQRNLELSTGPIRDLPGGSFGLEDATHVLGERGLVRAWRARGVWQTAQRRFIRLPVLHPSLDRPVRRARRAAGWVRIRLLRSVLPDLLPARHERRIIHCFGDRQALVFGDVRSKGLLPRTWIDVVSDPRLSAASLNGVGSPGTRIARRVIDRLPKGRTLVFMVGGMDEDPDAMHRYTGFLESLLEEGRRHVVVAAVPPRLEEGALDDRSGLVPASEATRRVNASLRAWCAEHGCRFLDYETDVLDPESGLARDEFRLQGQREFHLDAGPWSEVLAEHLRRAGVGP